MAKEVFLDKLKLSLEKQNFVKLTFSKYRGDDKEFENIFVNKIKTKEGEKLSFIFRYKTKDVTKNYDFDVGIKLINEVLGKDFLSATLFTTEKDYTLDYSKKRIPHLYFKKSLLTSLPSNEHNKLKSRFIDANSKYFYALGIATSEGKIKADKYNKFRQVDKFIEIIDSLYRSSELQNKNEIKIVDMGAGKSYLTFALYDFFSNTLKKETNIKGIEQREELVRLSNEVAEECNYNGLLFENGSIEDFSEQNIDIVLALHACDTATDDAIYKAVRSNARIIILAPCCHKYLRKQMKSPHHMKEIYKHGILFERLSESVTDGLRALLLEYYGYKTKVFEFISTEHTAKNTMITAVKKGPLEENKLNEIELIKKEFGIEDFYLDKKFL